jgi:polysaccharide biosynthesis protein PslJ
MRSAPPDGTTFLTCYLVLLFAIPSRLIIGPLGAAGTPAQLVGIAATLWWFWHMLAQPLDHEMQPRPMRRAMLVLVAAILASYIAAMSRPIAMIELSSTEIGLLSMLSWLGVLLVANDGIPDRRRLDVLVRRLVLAGGLVAALGVLQFATGTAFTDLIQIPGLTSNSVLVSVRDREGFNRPSGTALHPIEFGTTLAVLLPLCLHLAFHPGGLGRLRRWFPVAAVSLAIPLSISRSAIVGAAVVLVMLLPTWTRSARRWTLAAIASGTLAMFVIVPGFLGTITRLFTGISKDTSARSRTDSYAMAWEFVERAPLTGRGFLTFMPEYRILDNQYLGMLIDTGFLGSAALIALFTTGVVVAVRQRRRSEEDEVRSLALSLAASVSAAAVSFFFFDAFSFPMLAGVTFLVLGLIGALHSLDRPATSTVGTQENSAPAPGR